MTRRVEAVVEASAQEQAMIVASLARPDLPLYVEQSVLPVHSAIDKSAFTRAMAQLVDDHAALRSCFYWKLDTPPKRVVLSSADISPRFHDVSGFSRTAQAARLQEIADRARLEPFDLEHGPLMRVDIVTTGPATSYVVWTHHHSVLDGSSQMLILSELIASSCATSGARGGGTESDHLPLEQGSPFQVATISVDADGTRTMAQRAASENVSLSTLISARVLDAWQAASSQLPMAGMTVSTRSQSDARSVGNLTTTVRLDVDPSSGRTLLMRVHAAMAQCVDRAQQASRATTPEAFELVIAVSNYETVGFGTSPVDLSNSRHSGGFTRIPLVVVVELLADIRIRVIASPFDDGFRHHRSFVESLSASVAADARQPPTVAHAPVTASGPVEKDERGTGGPPDDDIVERVGRIMSAALGRDVGRDDDFFAVGGSSLAAIKVRDQLRRELGLPIGLADLLEHRTPARLAAVPVGGATQPPRAGESDSADDDTPRPLSHAAPAAEFALTPMQEAYWVGRRPDFVLGGVPSRAYAEFEVERLDIALANRVLNALVARHGALRTTFSPEGRQSVMDTAPPISITEHRARSRREFAARMTDVRHRLECRSPADGEWPLFDVEYVHCEFDATDIVVVGADLLIGDARSWQILYEEFVALYKRPSIRLPSLELGFDGYVDELARREETDEFTAAREYWQDRLRDMPPPPSFDLALDAAENAFDRDVLVANVDRSAELIELSRQVGVTASVLMLTMVSEVIGATTGQTGFTVNTTVYDRPRTHPDFARMVGDFTSAMPVEVNLRGSLEASARELQERMFSNLEHISYPGIYITRRETSQGSGIPNPIVFTSTLDVVNAPSETRGEGLGFRYSRGIGQTPQVAIDIQVVRIGDEIHLLLDTRAGAVRPRLRSSLREALAYRLLMEVRETAAAPDDDGMLDEEALLHADVLAACRRSPDRPAILDSEGVVTFGELATDARRLASAIQGATAPGVPVPICLPRGRDQVVAALAVLLAGSPFVPVEHSWPESRIRDVISAVGAQCVVSEDLEPAAGGAAPTVVSPRGHRGEGELARTVVRSSDVAYIIFTSGSTGRPKGVIISHRAALNTCRSVNELIGVRADDRVLNVSSLAFDLSIYDMFGVMGAGGAFVAVPSEDARDPEAWARHCIENGITIWNSTPTPMELLAETSRWPEISGLKTVLLSGDWIPVSLARRLRDERPSTRLLSLGGATEAAIWSVHHEIGIVGDDWTSVPYGTSLPNQEVVVRDDALAQLPTGCVGEITISGAGLADGYWGAPELTAKSFVHAPDGSRVYRTGDLGRLSEDGTIEFLGRSDGQVKVAGHRIETKEVELALESLSGVESARVGVVGGRHNPVLVAAYVGTLSGPQCAGRLRLVLPSYMIPSRIKNVEALPLSDNGKVDLASLFTGSSPDAGHDNASRATEELARCVAGLLGHLPAEDANLVDEGMTSVMVIRLMNFINERHPGAIQIRDFYASPTLAALASRIDTPESSRTLGVSTALGADLDRIVLSVRQAVAQVAPAITAAESLADRFHLSSIEAIRLINELERLEGVRLPIGVVQGELDVGAVAQVILKATSERAGLASKPRTGGDDSERHVVDDIAVRELVARRVRSRADGFAVDHRLEANVHHPRVDHSVRTFASSPVSLQDLARLLSGVTVDGDGRSSYPSAGGLYPVDVLVLVMKADDFEPGIYRVLPRKHGLQRLLAPMVLSDDLFIGTANDGLVAQASFALFFVWDRRDVSSLYGDRSRDFALLEAGHIGQQIAIHAAQSGLGVCPVDGIDFERVSGVLDPDSPVELLYAMVGGVVR